MCSKYGLNQFGLQTWKFVFFGIAIHITYALILACLLGSLFSCRGVVMDSGYGIDPFEEEGPLEKECVYNCTDEPPPGTITLEGLIWRDLNENSSKEPSEPGWASGTKLSIYDCLGNFLTKRTSNKDGTFWVSGLPVCQEGEHYTITMDALPDVLETTTNETVMVNASAEGILTVDFGATYKKDIKYFDLRPDWIWPERDDADVVRRTELNQKGEPAYFVMHDQTSVKECVQSIGSSPFPRAPIDFSQQSSSLHLCYPSDAEGQCMNDGPCYSRDLGPVAWSGHGSIGGWAIFSWDDMAQIARAEDIADYHNYKHSLDATLKAYLDRLPNTKQAAISVFTFAGGGAIGCSDKTPSAIQRVAPSRLIKDSPECWAPSHSELWMKTYALFVRELMEYVQNELDALQKKKIAAWWIATGFWGESNTEDKGAELGNPYANWLLAHSMSKGALWYNYEAPGYPDVAALASLSEDQVQNRQQPQGSMLSPIAVWERWVGSPYEVWVIGTSVHNAFYLAEFCKAAEIRSPRGPMGFKQHGWVSDAATHHSGTETTKRPDYWGQADIWLDMGPKAFEAPSGQRLPNWYDQEGNLYEQFFVENPGGYGQFMLGGQEHAYGANKHDTYRSWLFAAAIGITQFDTEEKFFAVGHNLGSTLIAQDHWQFVRRYTNRNHKNWVGTFRFFRMGRPDSRCSKWGRSFYNNDKNDDRNDFVKRISNYHHNDMVILTEGAPVTRVADGTTPDNKGVEPEVACPDTLNEDRSVKPDPEYAASPVQLRDPTSSHPDYFYGWQSLAQLNLETNATHTLEIQPFFDPDAVPTSQLAIGDEVEIIAVVANYKHAMRLGYGDDRKMEWSNTLAARKTADSWTTIRLGGVSYHPEKTIRLQVTQVADASAQDYIHLIIFQKPWEDNLDWSLNAK